MKLSPKFNSAFCPNINDPVVKLLHLALGEDGLYEFFLKIQTKEFKDWKGDDLFPKISLDENDEVIVYNNRGDDVNMSDFIKTSTANIIGKAKQNFILKQLDEKAPVMNHSKGIYVTKTDEEIKNRVTDDVKKNRRWVNDITETPKSRYLMDKGSVMHSYLSNIITLINNNENYSADEVRNRVVKEMKGIPGLAGKEDNFFYMDDSYISKLHSYMKGFIEDIKKKDPNAVIRTEQAVHSIKEDKAGTIDILVITGKGKIKIYDFKSINFDPFDTREIKDYKKDDWTVQLEGYKKILMDDYNLKAEDFEERRVIPIEVSFKWDENKKMYSEGGWLMVDVGFNDLKTYLSEIPSRYELTANHKINDELTKLFNRRDLIKSKLETNFRDEKLKGELFRLNRIIENLQVKNEFNFVFQDLTQIGKEFEAGRNTTDESNPNYLSMDRLLELKHMMDSIQGLVNVFITEKLPQLEKTNKELYTKFKPQLHDYNSYQKIIYNDILGLMKQRIEDRLDLNLDTLSKSVEFGDTFKQLSDINHIAFKGLSKIMRESEHEIYDQLIEWFKDIDTISNEVKTWAKTQNKTLQQAYNLLINPKTGKLFGEFKPDIYEEIKKKQDEQDLKWLKENTTFNAKKFDEVKEAKFKEWDRVYTPEKSNIMKANFEKFGDIRKSEYAYYNKSNKFLKPLDIPANKNQQWLELQHIPALKNYYDMYIKYNNIFDNMTDRDVDRYFIANIRRDVVDTIGQQGLGSLADFKLSEYLKRSFEIQQDDEALGNIDQTTGNAKSTIPLLHYHTLEEELTDKELQQIKAELLKTHQVNTKEYKEALDKEIFKKKQEKGIQNKSYDLTTNLKAFAQTVVTHRALKDREAFILGLRELMTAGDIKEVITNNGGNAMVNKLTGEIAKKLGVPQSSLELFDKYVQGLVYGQSLQGSELIKIGDKVSSKKVFRGIIQYMSIKSLSFNIYSMVQNTIGGNANLWINAQEGIFFTNKGLREAAKDYSGLNGEEAKQKYNHALEYFGISMKHSIKRKIQNTSSSWWSKYFNKDLFYKGQEKLTSQPIQNDVTVGMMKQYGVLNGLPVNLNKMPVGTKSIWELATMNKDGKMEIKELSKQGHNEFKDMAHNLSARITGEIPESDIDAANFNIMIRALLQFRRWVIPLGKARFKGTHKEAVLNEFLVGRYTAVLHNTLGGIKGGMTEFVKMIGEASLMGIYKNKINTEALTYFYNKFIQENPQYKNELTVDQYIDFHQRAMRGTAQELRFMLAIAVLIAIAANIDWDDDDKPDYADSFMGRQFYKLLTRGNTELTFWVDPNAYVQTIGRSFIPATGVFTDIINTVSNTLDESTDFVFEKADMGDRKGFLRITEDKNDQTPMGYYTTKLIPLINPATQFFELFEHHDSKK